MTCSRCGRENPQGARFCGACGAPMLACIDASAEAVAGVLVTPILPPQPADFALRFSAWALDTTFLFIGYVLFSALRVGALLWEAEGGGAEMTWIASAVILVAPTVYFWLFTGLVGQTPGKMLVGIKVVDRSGNKPGLSRAALRESVGKTLSTIPLGLGFLWGAWDPRKQGWHDKIAGTFVVASGR